VEVVVAHPCCYSTNTITSSNYLAKCTYHENCWTTTGSTKYIDYNHPTYCWTTISSTKYIDYNHLTYCWTTTGSTKYIDYNHPTYCWTTTSSTKYIDYNHPTYCWTYSNLCIHYNKRCPYTLSDFTRFWMNSLVVMNGDEWRSSDFTGLMNGD